MMAGERIFGALQLENHERDNAFGPAEVRLLETITASMAVALLNAKSYEAERQRAAELAIVNSVQAGWRPSWTCRPSTTWSATRFARSSTRRLSASASTTRHGLVTIPYLIERGRRIDAGGPRPPAERGFAPQFAVRARHCSSIPAWPSAWPSLAKSPNKARRRSRPSGCHCAVQRQSRGAITVQDLDRENAFTEADARLLETLAASMSVALENARLFDETQRLFKETEAARSRARHHQQRAGRRSPPSSTCRASTTRSATRSARSSSRPTSASGSTIRRPDLIHFPYVYRGRESG